MATTDDRPAPGPGRFRCDVCGGVFGELLTKDEAEAQFRQEFPGHSRLDRGVACDDCFEKMKAAGVFEPN